MDRTPLAGIVAKDSSLTGLRLQIQVEGLSPSRRLRVGDPLGKRHSGETRVTHQVDASEPSFTMVLDPLAVVQVPAVNEVDR